ncbi:MAG: putative Ig domain-containing protein [Bryobacteraceae bacterium]
MSRAHLVLGLWLVLPIPLNAADIEFVTQELPWAIVDHPYNAPPFAVRTSGACPLGGVGYAVVAGKLPDGMELSRLGYFSGTPLKTGAFEFAVRVSNGCTWTARHFVLTVTGAPILTVSPARLSFVSNGGEVPAAQKFRVSATWPRFSYSVSSNVEWLKGIPEHGFTPRAMSAMAEDFVSVSVDVKGLSAGKYFGELAVSGWEILSAPVVHVELVVEGANARAKESVPQMPKRTAIELP